MQSAPPTGPTGPTTSLVAPFEPTDHIESAAGDAKKQKRRSFFGFSMGRKKGADAHAHPAAPSSTSPLQPAPTLVPATAPAPVTAKPTLPVLPPSSPPRISSPARSQIFERDVQESSSVPMPSSPAIPAHITTENMIPPVLDASSEAITDGHLDPDTVEIITHTHHLTVARSTSNVGMSSSGASGTGAWVDDLASSFATDRTDRERDDGGSNYGAHDADVRRLSFISFADVVQAEQHHHQQHHQPSIAALSSNCSPSALSSPMRSPPTSKSGSVKGLELSPPRKTVGSPTPRSPKLAAAAASSSSTALLAGSDISVETMAQALRRTASGDLGVRSPPQSPV